jgi:cytochrome P450
MSLQTLDVATVLPAQIRRAPRHALAHIPGDEGWPLVGRTLHVLADPKGEAERMAARFGPVYRTRLLGETGVCLLGPEANEFVLGDQTRLFSSALGWGALLERLFPRGLMLLDFEEHRMHRRALSVAFKAEAMKSYLATLDAGIAAEVARWRGRPGPMRLYPAVKQLTFDLAAVSFLGPDTGRQMDDVKRAISDMVAASLAVIRRPWPGTSMARGVRGRAHIVGYFAEEVSRRRGLAGEDLFSQLCRATDDNGALLSTQEIIDHMSFLMTAAHDTLTSSLTTLVYFLALNPRWQTALRDEVLSLGLSPGQPLAYENLAALTQTEMAFKEAMRLKPPVPSVARRALRDFAFGGTTIPAGTLIGINQLYTHHMAEHWPEPDRFDPTRFTDAAQRERHRYAYVPFGGGAHMCLGMHFAYMQAKCFARHFLQNLTVSLEPGYRPDWQMWPIPKPKDGLRVNLKPAN